MATTEEISQQILDSLANKRRTSVDGLTVEEQSLADKLEALRQLQSSTPVTTTTGTSRIQFARFRTGGGVEW